MIAKLKPVLMKAKKEGYAVGAFNTNNMETTAAIIEAAQQLNSPVIVAISEGALDYGGDALVEQVKFIAQNTKIPVVIHLDHGKSLEVVKRAIRLGFSSIMIDGSAYSFEKNLKLTKQARAIAKKGRVSIEAELGTIGGTKNSEKAMKIIYPKPIEVEKFVIKTRVDAIALGLGTSHGVPVPNEHVELELLKEVAEIIKTPIVLHGASNLPPKMIRAAIRNGITKINIDTEIRQIFTKNVREYLNNKKQEIDLRKYLGAGKDGAKKVVMTKIRLFGSDNKA